MPKVSVVMPVYNSHVFLAEAIESVLLQTFTDFEFIIIIEHGSSKPSFEIVEAYAKKDNRIKQINNEKPLGISASLNAGINEACGDYIARMDADDICMANRFNIQVAFMERHRDIGLSGGNVQFINKNGKSLNMKDNFPLNYNQIKSDLLFYCCLRHPTVILRRDLINKFNLRYNPDFKTTEDFEFWNRLCHHMKIANIEESLLFYRWYEENATHKKSTEGIENYIKVMKSSFEIMGFDFNSVYFKEEELKILCPMTCRIDKDNYKQIQRIAKKWYYTIIDLNKKNKIYDDESLIATLNKRFYWINHPVRKFAVISIRYLSQRLNQYSIHKNFLSMASYIELNGFYKTILRLVGEFKNRSDA